MGSGVIGLGCVRCDTTGMASYRLAAAFPEQVAPAVDAHRRDGSRGPPLLVDAVLVS